MNHLYRAVLFLLLILYIKSSVAQNISGTWEGYFNGEYLQINVQQQKNELCGFTYDYELSDRNSYCIANFKGRYDREKGIYYLAGTGFIENSGSHVLMRIILWKDSEDKRNTLRGKVVTGSDVLSIFGMGGDNINLSRISYKAKEIPGIPPCFPKPVAEKPVRKLPVVKDSVQLKKEIAKTGPVKKENKPQLTKPVIKNKIPDPVKRTEPDSSAKNILKPQPTETNIKPPSRLEHLMATRKQSEQSRISIDVNEINLKLYDNGTVDNDTVSVFYNGRLLLSHQKLSEKAIELNIRLDESKTQHEITLFAENLGSIPPNTSLVVVTAGKKRYELRSRASMEENAVLIFEYNPK